MLHLAPSTVPIAPPLAMRAPRTFMAFLGPAIMVSVGYMDPGNWATDLEGGARFGYQLLWVLVVSNLMALLLQSLCARLGIVSGTDLASGCRGEYARPLSFTLWVLAELAIIACDLAEVLGSAVALNLLFGLPLLPGALLTGLDVLLILALQHRGMRRLEAVVLVLLLTLAACMLIVLWMAQPSWGGAAAGLVPRLHAENLYIAIGILGATVMPHNLYLHSALVPRAVPLGQRPAALRQSMWSTAIALNIALLINAAILLVAAAVFARNGLAVSDIRQAHELLSPLLGTGLASLLFAVGLLCSGQSATISGTLAGQVVMDGFLQMRWSPVARRLLTRGLAIVPALVVLGWVGDAGLMSLLIGSQVVLSLQLPFAVVPLIRFTSSPAVMGEARNRPLVTWLASACAAMIVLANAFLVVRVVSELREHSELAALLLAGLGAAGLGLLCVVASVPLRSDQREQGVSSRSDTRGAATG